MKRYISVIVAVVMMSTASAQSFISYFMEGATQRSYLNPALAPNKGYFNIPVIGSAQLGIYGDLTLNHIIQKKPDGSGTAFVFNRCFKFSDIPPLKENNILGMTSRFGILDFGAYTKNQKVFWSVAVNFDFGQNASIPRSLYEFMKSGESASINNVKVGVDVFSDISFNISFPIGKKVYLGTRVKAIMGSAESNLNISSLDILMNPEIAYVRGEGYFELFGPKIKEAVGKIIKLKDLPGAYDLMKVFSPSGGGAAIDLGITYDVAPWLQLSAAVNNLGFISYSKAAYSNLKLVAQIQYRGTSVEMKDDGTFEIQEGGNFDLGELDFEVTGADPKHTTKMLEAQVNAGADFELFNHILGIGILYNGQFSEFSHYHNFFASLNIHPTRWFGATASYTLVNGKNSIYGVALNFSPGFLNFFIGTDFLFARKTPQFIPISQSNCNVTFGLGIPIGKWGHRVERWANRDIAKRGLK